MLNARENAKTLRRANQLLKFPNILKAKTRVDHIAECVGMRVHKAKEPTLGFSSAGTLGRLRANLPSFRFLHSQARLTPSRARVFTALLLVFLCLILSPRAPLEVLKLLGKVWVLAFHGMSAHASYTWTSLVFKNVGDVDSRRLCPRATTRLERFDPSTFAPWALETFTS